MCRRGCSREAAERQLKAEQSLQTFTQNIGKVSLRERAEALLEAIENDYATDRETIELYKADLLTAINEAENKKQQNIQESELVKLEIIGVLRKYFSKQESEWTEKISVLNGIIEHLKQTQTQLATETKQHHDAYMQYVELIDDANERIREANDRIRELNRG